MIQRTQQVGDLKRFQLQPESSQEDQSSFGVEGKVFLPPWAHGKNPRNSTVNVQDENLQSVEIGKNLDGIVEEYDNNVEEQFVGYSTVPFELLDKGENFDAEANKGENFDAEANEGFEISKSSVNEFSNVNDKLVNWGTDILSSVLKEPKGVKKQGDGGQVRKIEVMEVNEIPSRVFTKNGGSEIHYNGAPLLGKKSLDSDKELASVKVSAAGTDSSRLPWIRASDEDSSKKGIRSNTELAEKLLPEPELRRLRNMALRMVERIKVGAAGVNQALVDSIHEKWRHDEVVKMKFEGPHAANMKRTHEFLESRTGGLVIWRSGSSVVLFRGLAYKLPCVQSYTTEKKGSMNTSESSGHIGNGVINSPGVIKSLEVATQETTDSRKYLKNLSDEELMDLSELDHLLDELGPRFKDWTGRHPLPIDADLLPSIVKSYRTPFRLLPHGVRRSLRDKEMTYYRRTARTMPPHFALARSRELQGLALAMVKLWEKSALAKIAIKRGVHNTNNERMAEELKVLTGGTLVSRNKDYIVFYRGNDFLAPRVMEALVEAKESAVLRQDEEEMARERAATSINTNAVVAKRPLVAGTLNETMAATSRWANNPSTEDLRKMMKESAVARHSSLVKFLEMKLARAKEKIRKAENAILKVQRNKNSSELPTDLETLTNEERFLFRKMGLSMKPFLPLGRRGVFGGTVENMHLHWKYRELVKIVVERKNLAQVKHIAISLEAESGGVLVSVEKFSKGHAIIIYRGKNYQRPDELKPKNLLTKRQALARSIELQRREALKHHVLELQDKMQKLKTELDELKNVKEVDEATLYSRMDNASDDEEDDDDKER